MPRRTISIEEKQAKIDEKIQYHQKHIDRLKQQREALTESKSRMSYKAVVEALKANGLTPEEALERLCAKSE